MPDGQFVVNIRVRVGEVGDNHRSVDQVLDNLECDYPWLLDVVRAIDGIVSVGEGRPDDVREYLVSFLASVAVGLSDRRDHKAGFLLRWFDRSRCGGGGWNRVCGP